MEIYKRFILKKIQLSNFSSNHVYEEYNNLMYKFYGFRAYLYS